MQQKSSIPRSYLLGVSVPHLSLSLGCLQGLWVLLKKNQQLGLVALALGEELEFQGEVRTRCTNVGDEYTAEISSLKTR